MFFKINVPHVLEKILLYLDYESYKTCFEVSNDWRELLTSDLYQRKAKDLFQREITEDEEKLWSAAQDGNVEKITRLLSIGLLDVNSIPKYLYTTPLMIAALKGHKDVVNLLLNKGAEIDKCDDYGKTPLHVAAWGHLHVVELFLDRGAQHDSRNRGGRAPLHMAAEGGHKDVVKVFLDHGTDVDIKDNYGFTPLTWAAMMGHMEIVQLLLKMGADPNARNLRGETPLERATRNGHKHVVQVLLKYAR